MATRLPMPPDTNTLLGMPASAQEAVHRHEPSVDGDANAADQPNVVCGQPRNEPSDTWPGVMRRHETKEQDAPAISEQQSGTLCGLGDATAPGVDQRSRSNTTHVALRTRARAWKIIVATIGTGSLLVVMLVRPQSRYESTVATTSAQAVLPAAEPLMRASPTARIHPPTVDSAPIACDNPAPPVVPSRSTEPRKKGPRRAAQFATPLPTAVATHSPPAKPRVRPSYSELTVVRNLGDPMALRR